jgi:hypothetical protein
MKLIIFILVWGTLSSSLASASENDDANTADVHCMLRSLTSTMAILKAGTLSENPVALGALITAPIYFVGRIDARSPNFDMAQSLSKESDKMEKMTVEESKAETKHCSDVMQAKGEKLKEIGRILQEQSAK